MTKGVVDETAEPRSVERAATARSGEPFAKQIPVGVLRRRFRFASLGVILRLAYVLALRPKVSTERAKEYLDNLSRNVAALEQVAAQAVKPSIRMASLDLILRLAYVLVLKRNVSAKRAWKYLDKLSHNIATTSTQQLIDDLSDGEFILIIAELLFEDGGANPAQLEHWKQFLREDSSRRSDLINRLIFEQITRLRTPKGNLHNPDNCWIMGTDDFLTPEAWRKKASQIAHKIRDSGVDIPLEKREFRHSGEYVVSAIASLYKGRRYLKAFLENITSQSLFDRSELIIIDADSPEGEAELILEYQKVYPNIVYQRMNYRIGIYDAWNVGVGLARGMYLTNTNLDDLRRKDSFELQAAALDEHGFADVVYQDVYYSLDSGLDFDRVAEHGFKSNIPIITANNLLCYNSPHNAPMWRTRLHKEVGMFDTSFRSAGDYEFWFRCILNNKKFYKINSPHVVYFQNPAGISTSPDTKGLEEARRLKGMYARKLISPYLTMSRRDFAAALDVSADWGWETPAYNVVQKALRRAGGRRDPLTAN